MNLIPSRELDLVIYRDGHEGRYEAIQLSWGTVNAILGRDHNGTPEDDETLIEALRAAGSPEWIFDADGWIDDDGWGLYDFRHPIDY